MLCWHASTITLRSNSRNCGLIWRAVSSFVHPRYLFWNTLLDQSLKNVYSFKPSLAAAVRKMRISLRRYYLIYAVMNQRMDKVSVSHCYSTIDQVLLLTKVMTRRNSFRCMEMICTLTPNGRIGSVRRSMGTVCYVFAYPDAHAALPYVKNPETDDVFAPYFQKQWAEIFAQSLHNFLSSIFQNMGTLHDPPLRLEQCKS